MGCHTWFSVPYLTEFEEIKKLSIQEINRQDYKYAKDYIIMYNFAIENNLKSVICDLAMGQIKHHCNSDGINIYMDVSDYEFLKYNEKHGNIYETR